MARHHHSLDPGTADRLLTGGVDPDDAPPGYRRAAGLLQAAATVPSASSSAVEAGPVSAIAAAVQSELAAPPDVTPRRSNVLSKLLVGKSLAALTFVTLSAGAAGATTGHLPDPIQNTVASAAKHAGVELPRADKSVKRVTTGDCVKAADDTYAKNRGQYLKQERAKGEVALAAAKASRCGMPINSKDTPGADDEAEADDQSGGESKKPADASNNGKKDAVHGQSEGKGQSGRDNDQSGDDQGAPADDPADSAAVDTPNDGGIDTAGTASDGANVTGEDKAAPAADKGSANSDDHPGADDHSKGEEHSGETP